VGGGGGAPHIRLSSLELIAHEIYEKSLCGDVAELGVYQGDFAQYINLCFPDRKLYLFDTFEGFNEKDIRIESKNSYSFAKEGNLSFQQIEKVMEKMKYPANVIIKRGWFPETANGVDSEFVFVSIDADLFQPIYNGLVFFYPRLKQGGFILVHDYNNVDFSGSKAAVRKFSVEHNASYFPLSDNAGTAVFTK
jgi:O-methyltransferase